MGSERKMADHSGKLTGQGGLRVRLVQEPGAWARATQVLECGEGGGLATSGDSSVTGTRSKAVQGFDIVGELKDKGNPTSQRG